MVTVMSVSAGSPAHKAGIKADDIIISIDGNNICDVIDYDFYTADSSFSVLVHRGAELLTFKIKKDEYEPLGCEFESFLMDKKHSCKNKCAFCFIDQNPKGMRESIYFKDDDSRMSFLAGNYITLTNLSDADVERIVKMHISPINVSVHTTNPELRVKLMGNKNAGKSLSYMDRFAENGIWMNVQIVLCPGLNDKAELERSLKELERYVPALQSIAVVPVGLTKHRDGLYPLRTFTKDEAKSVIETVDRYGDRFCKKYGERICYCADELYLKAELPIPEEEYYGDYPQFDNGVGLIRSFISDVSYCLDDGKLTKTPKPFSVVTGMAAYATLSEMTDKICKKYFGGDKSFVKLYAVENEFFGKSVTVAGLVTGGDIIRSLKGKDLGERLFIPKVMLRYEMDRFLDDVTLEELSEELGVEVVPVDTDGNSYFKLFQ